MPSSLKFLWVYSAADAWTMAWHTRLLKSRRDRGFDIKGFCTTIPYLKGRWLPFPELNYLWKVGDRALMQMYSDLAEQLEDRDVLILYNGANLHPLYVNWLRVMKVYTAGDPESESVLSRSVAPGFNVHLVNHVPSVDTYRGWGLKHVYFWPLGSLAFEEDVADLDEETICDITNRPLTIAFFNERSTFRHERVDRLAGAFPHALCAGRGWPRGFVDWPEMWTIYRQTQMGWNIHNSTGFNFRTYDLPAHGVMQICDNKSDLARIYEVGKEVVGFDSIDECIELTRYYLAHPREQREIALMGCKRWRKDYTPDKIWDRLVDIVERHWMDFSPSTPPDHNSVINVLNKLQDHKDATAFQRMLHQLSAPIKFLYRKVRGLLSKLKKTFSNLILGGQ